MSESDDKIDNNESSENKIQNPEPKSENNNIFGNKDSKLGNSPKPKFNIYWIYGLIILGFISLNLIFTGKHVVEITWKQFENEMLKEHDVEKIVVVNNERAEVTIIPDRLSKQIYKKYFDKGLSSISKQGPQFTITIGGAELFHNQLKDAQKDFPENERITEDNEHRKDLWGDMLPTLIWIVAIILIWLFVFRRMSAGTGGGGGNIFNVGKSRAQIFDKDTNVKTDFKDVAGLEEAKIEIKEIVDFLKNPKKYTDLGGKIPKGALLVGPPGTGKTLLAKAVAGEANVPFFSISGSDFVEMFVGVGASRVRDLFKQAKEKAPCIVFIDEIDAIGRARGKNPNFGANDERENTLNQLLTEMDGFATNTGVIILAATNRADILDRALLRCRPFRQANSC